MNSCRGKNALVIVVVNSGSGANRGIIISQCLCAERQATKSLSPMSSANFPLVYFEFSKRIGRHPKVLYSDLASEITNSIFERYLLVKGVNHINVPRGENHSIGVAEKAIQDLSNMMRCFLADSNVPNIYWDFVIEHAALVNSMISPAICDKQKPYSKRFGGLFRTLI